ncbi:NAD(P)/FAD-dependent oxidoreductase [Gluconacetobacter tumulisoli]|uniref:FAD-binding oxidoreductase n=1 Tax=Gluconacetobacter tumulisoli TaxID=1286189 RepID=A0A7W4K991_9PROT|nr:FAD-binding oxidoreductase [Gluconacetobacter tumulisoli]MBB2202635.1 FAD-binding oxidoreductase [Gluconacetobacter tumulisoli]
MATHRIQKLPVDTGVSGWEALSARTFPVRPLSGDVNADWLIIGAGFAGLSAARRLTQLRPHDKIVVLEAGEVAKGPAGRNSGFMIDVPHNLSSGQYSVADAAATRQEIRQNRFAIQFAADSALEYGMSSETFDPSGKINAAATRRGFALNEDYARSLGGIGEHYEMLDAKQMRDITGTDYYDSGLYTPGCTVIQPADYIHALAGGLSEKISLFEHSPVIELGRTGQIWRARSTRGTVSAPKVIVAVNGFIQEFGFFRGRLMHIFTYASMTAPFTADEAGRHGTGRPRWALLPADPMGATVRKITSQGQSRIVIRTRFTYDPKMQVSDDRVMRIARQQKRSFAARFKELGDIPVEYSWAGRLCLSRNHVPAFGEVEENLYSACCENGLGTVKSTLAGVMAADLAAGVASPQLNAFEDQPMPSRLPPEPMGWLGASVVIKWQEWRAGRER